MAIPAFRLAFWTLIVCLGLTTLLALVGSPAIAEPELRPRDTPLPPLPTRPDPRTRRRLDAIEETLAEHDGRLDESGQRIDQHDGLHCGDSKGLARLAKEHERSACEVNRRFGEGVTRLTAVERRLDDQARQLAAIRREIREIAEREPIVPPAETNLLFVPFPRPIVVTAERTEPPAPPEPVVETSPISLKVEIEAVEIPSPQPPPVRPPQPRYCNPCEPIGPHLVFPGLP